MSTKNTLAIQHSDEPLSFKVWIIALLVFTALLTFVFRDFIFHSDVLLSASDQIQGYGGRYLREGIFVSQWNPFELGGIPTYDALFGDALHPLVLLERLMSPERAEGFKFIVCVWIAFASGLPLFSLLARSWKIGALIAVLFAFNPQFFTLVYGGHDGKMMVVSILPLALWGLFLITRQGKWFGAFWLALGVSLMILSSQLQTTYYALLGLLFISLYENFLREKVTNWKLPILRQSLIGLAVAIAVAVGATQIIPPLEYTSSQSVRANSAHTSMEHATSWSIHPEEAVSLLLPGFCGNLPDKNGDKETYWGINVFKLNHDAPGMLLVLLGFAAFSAANRRREHLLWVWFLALPLIYALGAHTPWFQFIFELLPKAKMFRGPSMSMFWIATTLAILAAQWLGDVRRGQTQVKIGFVLSYASMLCLFAFARSSWFSYSYSLWVIFIIGFALIFVAGMGFQSQGQIWNWKTILAAIVFQLKTKTLSTIALILPWLALLPMKSSMEVQDRRLSDALVPFDQWQSAREMVMKNQSGEVIVSLMIGLLLAFVIWWALRKANTWNFAFLAIGAIGVAEAVFVDQKFVQTLPHDQIFAPEAMALADQIRPIAPPEQYRVLNLGQGLQDKYGPYYHLRMVLGFHDNEMASYRSFRSGQDTNSRMGNLLWVPSIAVLTQHLRAKGLDSIQVAKILSADPMQTLIQLIIQQNPGATPDAVQQYLQKLPPEKLQAMLAQAQQMGSQQLIPITIQEGLNPYLNLLGVKAIVLNSKPVTNDSAMSRWTGYSSFAVMSDEDAIRAPGTGFDYRHKIILDKAPALAMSNVPVTAQLKKVLSPDHYVGSVQAAQAGMVLFNENYSPNWHVNIDGSPAKTYKAFGTFLAFEVPQGQHQVDVEYNSAAIKKSLPISLVGLLALLGLAGLGFAFRRRPLNHLGA